MYIIRLESGLVHPGKPVMKQYTKIVNAGFLGATSRAGTPLHATQTQYSTTQKPYVIQYYASIGITFFPVCPFTRSAATMASGWPLAYGVPDVLAILLSNNLCGRLRSMCSSDEFKAFRSTSKAVQQYCRDVAKSATLTLPATQAEAATFPLAEELASIHGRLNRPGLSVCLGWTLRVSSSWFPGRDWDWGEHEESPNFEASVAGQYLARYVQAAQVAGITAERLSLELTTDETVLDPSDDDDEDVPPPPPPAAGRGALALLLPVLPQLRELKIGQLGVRSGGFGSVIFTELVADRGDGNPWGACLRALHFPFTLPLYPHDGVPFHMLASACPNLEELTIDDVRSCSNTKNREKIQVQSEQALGNVERVRLPRLHTLRQSHWAQRVQKAGLQRAVQQRAQAALQAAVEGKAASEDAATRWCMVDDECNWAKVHNYDPTLELSVACLAMFPSLRRLDGFIVSVGVPDLCAAAALIRPHACASARAGPAPVLEKAACLVKQGVAQLALLAGRWRLHLTRASLAQPWGGYASSAAPHLAPLLPAAQAGKWAACAASFEIQEATAGSEELQAAMAAILAACPCIEELDLVLASEPPSGGLRAACAALPAQLLACLPPTAHTVRIKGDGNVRDLPADAPHDAPGLRKLLAELPASVRRIDLSLMWSAPRKHVGREPLWRCLHFAGAHGAELRAVLAEDTRVVWRYPEAPDPENLR